MLADNHLGYSKVIRVVGLIMFSVVYRLPDFWIPLVNCTHNYKTKTYTDNEGVIQTTHDTLSN